MNTYPKNSCLLTIHNKDFLIDHVVNGILNSISDTTTQLIVVFDGCTDNSEAIVKNRLKDITSIKIDYVYTDDVFETKANNAGLKKVENEFVTIIQDDMVIVEQGFDKRLMHPFKSFDDVFAVTSFVAHNNIYDEEKQEIGYIDMASKSNSSRDIFYAREYGNRGPLMYNFEDVVKLNYLDEYFYPQNYDDMDISMRALKELGKVSGLYWIGYISDLGWGATRRNPNPILNDMARISGAKILEKHRDLLYSKDRVVENRELVWG